MAARWHIETLNDLFYALFRPGDSDSPVIQGQGRLVREDYFQLLFPEELCRQYAGKSKSNLTWFFNDDRRNKAIKRTLIAMLEKDPRQVVDGVHQKCREVLWPQGRHAAFDPALLREVLGSVRVKSALNARLHIVRSGGTDASAPVRLDAFLDADASAALARMILTLATMSDAPEDVLSRLWSADTGASHDFMRRDDTPEGQIRYCRMLDLEGRRTEAFESFEKLARKLNRPAETPDESAMYCRMGEMLYAGDGHFRDEKEALRYFTLGCLDANPRSYYLLAVHSEGAQAREAMERAASLGYAPALLEMGNAFFGGSARLGCDPDPEAARLCFQRGMGLGGEDGARCAYMLGRVCETRGDRAAALNAYRVAREGGSAEASERLSALDWALASEPARENTEDSRESSGPVQYCLLNGASGANRAFYENLRGAWDVSVCGVAPDSWKSARACGEAVPEALAALARSLYAPNAAGYPRLAVALLSDDWRENLGAAIACLGALQRHAALLRERAWEMADSIEIYVMAEHDSASAMLDAAMSGMNGPYFCLRLCDPAEDAADQLFSRAPLFLPCMRAPEDGRVRLNVVGCGRAAMAALRRAVALPMPESAELSVSVYGEEAERMASRFAELCPGAETAPPAVRRVRPEFHPMRYDGEIAETLRRIREAQGGGVSGARALTDEQERLGRGNYYVIATDDDLLNVRLGILLRSELLKLTPTFDNLPFIAVYVRDPVAGYLAGSISAGPSAAMARWYNQYDLFTFGMLSMYGCESLRRDPVERRAQRIHLLYAGLPASPEDRRAALSSYFRRQYNRDSSRVTAQSLIYRVFQAGIGLPSWRLYGMPEEEARLGPAYSKWLEEPGHLDEAARLEHERWNGMMLSLGWEPATPLQAEAYLQRGNPGHQLYLGKLHPFICGWQALESGELVRAVRQAVQARFPEKQVQDPREADREAVRSTELLMSLENAPPGA